LILSCALGLLSAVDLATILVDLLILGWYGVVVVYDTFLMVFHSLFVTE